MSRSRKNSYPEEDQALLHGLSFLTTRAKVEEQLSGQQNQKPKPQSAEEESNSDQPVDLRLPRP